ncbi:MAG: cytochrome b/b6 domain-containing protein [Acidimicrobiales bacterium]
MERLAHWATAVAFLVLVLTGAALFFPPLVALVGRRTLVERAHVYAGLSLPVILLLALVGPWGRPARRDLKRLNYWSPADVSWIKTVVASPPERDAARQHLCSGKFNAGQKLNAAFLAGAGAVMLVSGTILRWFQPFPLSWREGATFVHDWLAAVLVIVVAGHVFKAMSDPEALRSMLHGRIGRAWMRRHAPAWDEELSGVPKASAGSGQEPEGLD